MRLIIPIFTLFISYSSFTQGYIHYHNSCNEGAELIEKGLFLQAKELLNTAIKSVDEPLAIDYFNLAKCYSQLNETDSTLYFLELSLKLDSFIKAFCSIHHLWFKPVFGTEKWDQILDSNYYNYDKPTSKEQKKLVETMDKLLFLDQQYITIQTDSIPVYYPNDTLLYNLYSDSINFNIRIIQSTLDTIIAAYGWPGKKVTGRETLDGVLLIHVSDEWFEANSQLLIEQIDKGNLMPWHYANIADRKRHEHNLPVLYNGYFAAKNEVTEEVKINCKKIGVPLGKIRSIRAYFSMD